MQNPMASKSILLLIMLAAMTTISSMPCQEISNGNEREDISDIQLNMAFSVNAVDRITRFMTLVSDPNR